MDPKEQAAHEEAEATMRRDAQIARLSGPVSRYGRITRSQAREIVAKASPEDLAELEQLRAGPVPANPGEFAELQKKLAPAVERLIAAVTAKLRPKTAKPDSK